MKYGFIALVLGPLVAWSDPIHALYLGGIECGGLAPPNSHPRHLSSGIVAWECYSVYISTYLTGEELNHSILDEFPDMPNA